MLALYARYRAEALAAGAEASPVKGCADPELLLQGIDSQLEAAIEHIERQGTP